MQATAQSLLAFTEGHASGFHTKPAQRAASQASFGSLQTHGAMKIYVIEEAGKVVAGASMFLAGNAVAYLGTAVTQKGLRVRGFHAALIAHRIAQVREQGAVTVAATALANSQSRRNLQRAGLQVSHGQSLYRLLES
ncbi:GNAT family N-acetyltransferase [Pseudomonas sp. NPDC096917]|uniref:GNAT family N-acetyltransferase n=1 Tax=Pseudomonas sp. NPDC096917 TaxID=3364483 RepID=UPI00383B7EE8